MHHGRHGGHGRHHGHHFGLGLLFLMPGGRLILLLALFAIFCGH